MKSKFIDTRLAIALGTIDFLPDQRVSSGDGEAFRSSGDSLENMSKSRRMKFEYPNDEVASLSAALDIIVQLIDALAVEWTEKQAQAVTGALRGWTQGKIAKSWWENPITQQAVAQHLDRASWFAVENALAFFEKNVSTFINRD
jgi:hypothetical protein